MGGMNSNLRILINNVLKKKSKNQSDLAINTRNFYVAFSTFYKKLKYKQVYSHISVK